ncbi:MAG: hypothetical protein IJV00_07530 [Clostridia bacterium]|nr:hypothetical protein [Clostridia bacterium]
MSEKIKKRYKIKAVFEALFMILLLAAGALVIADGDVGKGVICCVFALVLHAGFLLDKNYVVSDFDSFETDGKRIVFRNKTEEKTVSVDEIKMIKVRERMYIFCGNEDYKVTRYYSLCRYERTVDERIFGLRDTYGIDLNVRFFI